MNHQIDLSPAAEAPVVELSVQRSPLGGALAYLVGVLATLLLFVSPALVIAAWRWLL